ncbi:MAG: hypothetical protein ABFD97_02750 [Syntrophobacter sp.]
MRKIQSFAVLLVMVMLPATGYGDDCPNRERMLGAAVKFERAVEDYFRLARSGRIESRESMYGSSTGKLDALRGDARRMLLVARALSGSAEDRATLKRTEGKDISEIVQGCSFPKKDLARLREDFETLSTEIARELTPQRTGLKRNWRDVEEAYRNLEDASENIRKD